MPESVPVRCPACRREHVYTAPSYPCACGAPVTPSMDRRAAPTPVTHRVWNEDWITVRCAFCGRRDQWPRPELGCPCGTVLRVPVAAADAEARPLGRPGANPDPHAAPRPCDGPVPRHNGVRPAGKEPGTRAGGAARAARRAAFRPVTIRTAVDAVTAAALYLRWLGYEDIRRADQRPPSGIGLAARGLVAQVDPAVRPASLRDVECLWLTAMTESAECVYFSLAGYSGEARTRADTLDVPLFVLDLTGTPQPVNDPADALNATGV
ncbi:hypothetical protein RKE30_12205 [Streptomyces sp. Li-HN-5-11]|uniref:hypothetical protein n=1 Tax=Streptomyces sp. Li-HN-5-11 TaxID=3075432 RepID=UPI0028A9DBAB|nr:hypothetical protein [Streptomyces sp. Li-HN-5-11]WNM31123.1 hypothetical protein RKE30_12205 [Streptomyces sp. Li-HN-5-11]